MAYGNSSGDSMPISFADFRGAPNARLQSFSYFTSEAEGRFAPDLGLLVALVGDGLLKPRVGVERSWREIAGVADQLRDRHVAGNAVLLVDAGQAPAGSAAWAGSVLISQVTPRQGRERSLFNPRSDRA